MGVGEFLSSKAHNEWVLSERKREQWELEHYPEGEVRGDEIELRQAEKSASLTLTLKSHHLFISPFVFARPDSGDD
jgi:hypothetical protein